MSGGEHKAVTKDAVGLVGGNLQPAHRDVVGKIAQGPPGVRYPHGALHSAELQSDVCERPWHSLLLRMEIVESADDLAVAREVGVPAQPDMKGAGCVSVGGVRRESGLAKERHARLVRAHDERMEHGEEEKTELESGDVEMLG